MQDFKRLRVWQKAHAMALHVDRVARGIRHNPALKSQMLRAAGSVPANIVEGAGQASSKDFRRYLQYAIGSVTELEYHLIIARDSAAITAAAFESTVGQVVEVRKMLHGLFKRVSQTPN